MEDPNRENTRPASYKVFIGIGILAAVFYFGTKSDSNRQLGNVNALANAQMTEIEPLSAIQTLPDEKQFYTPSDTVFAGNMKYKVRAFAFSKTLGEGYVRKTADGLYFIVKLDVTNTDKVEHTIDNTFFTLTDSTGTQYSSSSEGSAALELSGYSTLFLKQCNPGIKKNGWLCFELPREGVYDLHVNDGFQDGETAAIRLKP